MHGPFSVAPCPTLASRLGATFCTAVLTAATPEDLKRRAGGVFREFRFSPEVSESMRRWPAWTSHAVPALVRVLLGHSELDGDPDKRGRGRPPKKPRLLLQIGTYNEVEHFSGRMGSSCAAAGTGTQCFKDTRR